MTKDANLHYKQRFTSDVFWHFVGRNCSEEKPNEAYEILLSILNEGLRVGSNPEPFRFDNPTVEGFEEYIGYPICCLADIPLKDLPIHAARYGRFAIGFHKEYAVRNHFHPVLYVQQGSFLIGEFMKLRKQLEAYLIEYNPEMASILDQMLLYLGSIAKPCDFLQELKNDPESDDLQINIFYYEREWRSIYPWKFESSNVAMLIVENEDYISNLRDEIQKGGLRVNVNVPILSFDMVHKL